jgi:hypothetical protein
VFAVPLVLVVLLFLLAGCGDGSDSSSSQPTSNGDAPVHVHGLGVDPADGALFIATHTGLFRAAERETRAERVADRHQDTMGFTVAGPEHFLGSGHPDLREDLPPLLGLIESRNGGETWRSISLLGEADFHVLESRGRRVYGFDSTSGQLMLSRDGGRAWTKRTPPEPLLSLAIHPDDPDRLIASGEQTLLASTDGGRRWRALDGRPGFLAWPDRRRVYLLEGHGALQVSRNAGRRWDRVGDVGGQPAAFESTTDGRLLAALHDGTVKESSDRGESWRIRSRP